jgi:hypothetical protein
MCAFYSVLRKYVRYPLLRRYTPILELSIGTISRNRIDCDIVKNSEAAALPLESSFDIATIRQWSQCAYFLFQTAQTARLRYVITVYSGGEAENCDDNNNNNKYVYFRQEIKDNSMKRLVDVIIKPNITSATGIVPHSLAEYLQEL